MSWMLPGTIMLLSRILILAAVLVLTRDATALAEPLFALTEDGSSFLYSARPGDQPASVAAMFGIGPNELPAFLAANGVKDPTRITIGQVFRIPNPAASRAANAEAKAGALEKELNELRARAQGFDRELGEAKAAAESAERHAQRLAWLERVSQLFSAIGVLLILALGAAAGVAYKALRRVGEAERYAGTLAVELDEKRRALLAERQQAAKREIDLEAQVHDLELKLESGTRGRRSPIAR